MKFRQIYRLFQVSWCMFSFVSADCEWILLRFVFHSYILQNVKGLVVSLETTYMVSNAMLAAN